MGKELVVSSDRHETKVAILEDGQLVEVYFQRGSEYSLAGSIHKGRVTRVLPGMQSAFVDLGLERDTFLYVSDFFEEHGDEFEHVVEDRRGRQSQRREQQKPQQIVEPRPPQEAEAVETGGEAKSPSTDVVATAESAPANGPREDRRFDNDRRGRKRRRRRGGSRFPESKFASSGSSTESSVAEENEESSPEEASKDASKRILLPGESLAKYKRAPLEDKRFNASEPDVIDSSEDISDAAEDVLEIAAAVPEPDAPIHHPVIHEGELESEKPDSENDEDLTSQVLAQIEDEDENDSQDDRESNDEDGAEVSVVDIDEVSEDGEEETESAIEAQDTAEEEEAVEATESAAEGEEKTPVLEPMGFTAHLREPSGGRFLQQRSGRRNRRRGRGGDRGERSTENRPQEQRTEARTEERERERPPQPSITDLLKEGQEILVQIAKEPLGQKGARITSHIALPGRYCVYMPTVEHAGVSRKIASDEERTRLKKILITHKAGIPGGFIIRTAGEGKTETEIAADISYLYNLWLDIRGKAEKRKAPALVYHDLDIVERTLRDQLSDEFKAIWCDSEEVYESVLRFVQRVQPALVGRVKMFTRQIAIFDAFNVSAELEKALRPKVWLKSGGYIVINQTEALVAIDINTGKFVGKSNRLEDTIVKTNIEAVKEIVRQIRLRDLGGIIVIDFIDMDERKNRQKVMQSLEEAMRADRAPYKILQFNDFGLVAVTRKRVKQSLERTLCQPCPYCEGAGYVRSVQTVISDIVSEARKIAAAVDGKECILRVNPEVAKVLKSTQNTYLEELEGILKRPVAVLADPQIHHEKFDLS